MQGMNILPLLGKLIKAIPLEQLFPPRDPRDALRKFMEADQTATQYRPSVTPPADVELSPVSSSKTQEIATACVPCALGHFSRSAGSLEEAVRFKDQGLGSVEIIDRIGSVLKEQNALERHDLTPEKLQKSPPWEREIAEKALKESRSLRHKLEGIESIEQLEEVAADTAVFYRKLNREWFKNRFSHRGG